MDEALRLPGTRRTQFIELTPAPARRCFLVAVPLAHVLMLRDRRLAEIGLDGTTEAERDPRAAALHARLLAGALADACERAGTEATAAVGRRLGLEPVGPPRLETLSAPPAGDLILRVEIETLPEPEPPDPATLRIERLVGRPAPGDLDAALAELAAGRADWAELPPDARAGPGDLVICDVAARLLPPENRIPNPLLAGAEAGTPGSLPTGWTFGDNKAGLACEVVAVAPDADPPHLRLRIHGTAPADGQSFVRFHAEGAIAAANGSTWAGSLALRLPGSAIGLRGGKLRLDSKPQTGRHTLRRKDAALPLAPGAPFARVFVSDTVADERAGSVRLAVLFDHAAGPVDILVELALPRLVEGLDLGQEDTVAVPGLGGAGRRIEIGAADPSGLSPHLEGIAAGATREVTLRLPDTLDDRVLAGREVRVTLRATALLRRLVPEVDDAFAASLGLDGLAALRAMTAARFDARRVALEARQLRRAVLDALLASAGGMVLPDEAIRAELAAIWPRLSAEARPVSPEAARALAARRVRLGLLLRAMARRHDILPGEDDLRAAARAAQGTPEELRARALEDRVVAFVLERAEIVPREVSMAELAAAVAALPAD